MTKEDFTQILLALAQAWHEKDYQLATSFFAEGVAYSDPVRYKINSRAELLQFLSNDEGYPQTTTWHTMLFDEAKQIGAAEYTYVGTHQYHGVCLVKITNGLISHWREYQHISDSDYETFAGRTLF